MQQRQQLISGPQVMTQSSQTTNQATNILQTPPKIHRTDPALEEITGIVTSENVERLRMIENNMFAQAKAVWDILNENSAASVQGKSYSQIRENKEMEEELNNVRANAPIYQNWNTRKKTQFFKDLGTRYQKQLENDFIDLDELRISQNISETPQITQAQIENVKKFGKKIKKCKKVLFQRSELSQNEDSPGMEATSSKKRKQVSFMDESQCKCTPVLSKISLKPSPQKPQQANMNTSVLPLKKNDLCKFYISNPLMIHRYDSQPFQIVRQINSFEPASRGNGLQERNDFNNVSNQFQRNSEKPTFQKGNAMVGNEKENCFGNIRESYLNAPIRKIWESDWTLLIPETHKENGNIF